MYQLKRTPNGSVVFHGFPDFFKFYISMHSSTIKRTFYFATPGWLLGTTVSFVVGANKMNAAVGALISGSLLVLAVLGAILFDSWRMWRDLVRNGKKEDDGWNKVI